MGARIFEGDWGSLQEAMGFARTLWETGGLCRWYGGYCERMLEVGASMGPGGSTAS